MLPSNSGRRRLIEDAKGQGISEKDMQDEVGDLTEYVRDKLRAAKKAEDDRTEGRSLFGRDNVILTPHTSFYSVESLEELQTKAAEEVVRVLSGQPPRNPVNPEALAAPRAK